MIHRGMRVRLSEAFKADCPPGMRENMEEFRDCEGIVLGPMFEDDPTLVDVQWEPFGLRYGYRVDWLEKA